MKFVGQRGSLLNISQLTMLFHSLLHTGNATCIYEFIVCSWQASMPFKAMSITGLNVASAAELFIQTKI